MPSDSEMSTEKVRKRLMDLLGTDEVRINDRKYIILLQKKISEEQERKEIQKLKSLQEQEKKRERKLVLDGIVDKKGDNLSPNKKTNEKHNESGFQELAFEGCPKCSYYFKDKMRRDILQEDEGSINANSPKAIVEQFHGEEKIPKDDDENVFDNEKGEQLSTESKNEGFPEESLKTDSSDPTIKKEEFSIHSCSFLNRPYSARMELLIQEEKYERMLEIAANIISSGSIQV